MSRKYGASHDFDKVPSANIDRSSFNRSHGSKFTCDAGLIVPIFVDEVLPGDTPVTCINLWKSRVATVSLGAKNGAE
jgi:hypothetical protein